MPFPDQRPSVDSEPLSDIRFNDTQLAISAITPRFSEPRRPFISDRFDPFIQALQTDDPETRSRLMMFIKTYQTHNIVCQPFLEIAVHIKPSEIHIERYIGSRLSEQLRLKRDDWSKGVYHAWHDDGRIVSCYLKNGVLDGSCQFYRYKHYPGQQFHCHKGQLEGFHETCWPSGHVYEQLHYRKNVADGVCIRYYDQSKVKERFSYKEGIFHGSYRRWYKNGILSVTAQFSRGLLYGQVMTYHPTGSMHELIEYKEGRQHGHYQRRYVDGQLAEIANFIEGQKTGLCETYYITGTLFQRFRYQEGKKEGCQQIFHPNQRLKSETQYRQGVIDGDRLGWDESGVLIESAWYENDRRLIDIDPELLNVLPLAG